VSQKSAALGGVIRGVNRERIIIKTAFLTVEDSPPLAAGNLQIKLNQEYDWFAPPINPNIS
jgi:hypothetical protein